jgi:hypothetical protein
MVRRHDDEPLSLEQVAEGLVIVEGKGSITHIVRLSPEEASRRRDARASRPPPSLACPNSLLVD